MGKLDIIGITGGTGAGKTTALLELQKRGALIIDCDAVYHELLESSSEMLSELSGEFPEAFTDGNLDRKALGGIVFKDADKLLRLNGITHRYVGIAVKELLRGWKSKGGTLAAIDAIALIESGMSGGCSHVIAVTAPAEVRAERIAKREGISKEYAMLRIKAQKPDSFFYENCEAVLVNDCATKTEFQKKCNLFFDKLLGGSEIMEREQLLYKNKNAYNTLSDGEKKSVFDYCEGYKSFLDTSKTEREAVKTAIELAEKKGFVPYEKGMKLSAGDKVYKNNRGKALMLAVIGKRKLSEGVNIAAAHVDSPRLDLKQVPLYEDSELAMLKTHYYGGIKKYQWVTIPLALHGVVVKADGEKVDICIGEDAGDPVFLVTDLLPHLGGDQIQKKASEVITGEGLNLLFGSIPEGEEKNSDRVKYAVLKLLNEKYGMVEEDLLSAEICAVPAAKARDIGLDRSLIGSYGHDDRSCAYAQLKAILDVEAPEKTAVCVLADKEEIGSMGVSGMQSEAFEYFMQELCDSQKAELRECFANSFCLSVDVCNAFDPNFPEVSDKRNNAKLNYGLGVLKFSGARGKSGSSDASAEIIAYLRRVFAKNNVYWQMAELGKVDQGGGGTVAQYMANRNIDTIDIGVPVLSMHAPYETVSKLDCYMTYKGVLAVYAE